MKPRCRERAGRHPAGRRQERRAAPAARPDLRNAGRTSALPCQTCKSVLPPTAPPHLAVCAGCSLRRAAGGLAGTAARRRCHGCAPSKCNAHLHLPRCPSIHSYCRLFCPWWGVGRLVDGWPPIGKPSADACECIEQTALRLDVDPLPLCPQAVACLCSPVFSSHPAALAFTFHLQMPQPLWSPPPTPRTGPSPFWAPMALRLAAW